MIDRARPRPTRAALVVGALIGAVALAGCGAGQVTQTATQVAAVEGASGDAGPIAIRNAKIEFDEPVEGDAVHPAGGEAPLEMSIVNTGTELDRLVAASSPVAESVQINGVLRVPGGQTLQVSGAPEALVASEPAPAQPTGAAQTGGAPQPSGTAAPTPSAAPSPTAAAAPSTSAPIGTAAPSAPPAAGESSGANVVLTGLREDIQAGRTYPLVLTFERAGEVRMDVPVANPTTLREDEHAE